jgi:hypothetical protein
MASQLNIINLALNHIAQTPITASQLAANSTIQTQTALRVWEFAREETLRAYNWAFAKVQVALTVTTDYDPAVFTYAYVYPANCVAIRKINVQTGIDKAISEEFEIMYDTANEAIRIVTDVEDAYAEYTYDLDTPSLFDSAFVTAFALRLAAEMAIPLNGDPKQAEALAKLAANSSSDAKRLDSNSKRESHDGNETNNFVDARG